MSIKAILGLAAAGILLGSCQSKSYQISGFALECQQGDTICLASDENLENPFAQAIVEDGRFTFSGEADSTTLCHVYPKSDPYSGIAFFLEPGHITIEILPHPSLSRVSGTAINNEWQLLSDSIGLMAQEMAAILKTQSHDSTEQQGAAHAMDSLHRRMSDCILNAARRNGNNALGQYIQANYKGPEFR